MPLAMRKALGEEEEGFSFLPKILHKRLAFSLSQFLYQPYCYI
jgi:hypothetical protein